MENRVKKKIYQQWWFWVVIGVIVVVGIIGSALSGDEDDGSSENVSGTETSSETAFDWKTAEVTEENIRKVLKDISVTGFFYKDESVKIELNNVDEVKKKVFISIDKGTPSTWDNFARSMMLFQARYGKVLFENPNVESVMTKHGIELTKSTGQKEIDYSSYIIWSRETATKIELKGFEDNIWGDYTKCYDVSDKYLIHGSAYNKMTEKGSMPQSK